MGNFLCLVCMGEKKTKKIWGFPSVLESNNWFLVQDQLKIFKCGQKHCLAVSFLGLHGTQSYEAGLLPLFLAWNGNVSLGVRTGKFHSEKLGRQHQVDLTRLRLCFMELETHPFFFPTVSPNGLAQPSCALHEDNLGDFQRRLIPLGCENSLVTYYRVDKR